MMLWSHQIQRTRYQCWIFKLPFVRRYSGMVIGRTIFFKGSESEVSPAMLRHELIHQEQMDQHGVARFYFIYLSEYLVNFWRLRNHEAAYRSIQFEGEAYEREVL
jgi:hypothetical protein